MRKFLAIAALAAVLSTAGATLARADMGALDGDQKKGDWFIGFWDLNAPVAVRYMLTDDWEFGAGIGFNKPDEGDTGFALAFMATRRLIHASRAHLGVRPTVFIESNNPSDVFAIGADLVAEIEIASAVSLVASHGLEYISVDNGADDTSTIQTRLSTGSRVGFWVELP
ncbi:MAG TPA: hypothetical protein VF720_13940 [Candidatus Eisenbacteria bacterium]